MSVGRTISGLAAVWVVAMGTMALAHADILIGAAGPMTGTMAWFGEQMQQGMDMKVAELNASGGVLGQRVELLIVDDYCIPRPGDRRGPQTRGGERGRGHRTPLFRRFADSGVEDLRGGGNSHDLAVLRATRR